MTIENYDASNARHIRIARRDAKLREQQEREVVTTIMSTTNGRMWILSWLEKCSIFSSPFTGIDARTNFNCGQHNLGIQLFNQVVALCPNEYVRMMQERNERDAARSADAESKRSENRDGGIEGSGSAREPESEYEPGAEGTGEESRH